MSKLGQYQKERLKLLAQKEELDIEKKALESKIRGIAKRLKEVGNAIYDLKHEGDVPHITDHAVVRYLERVKKVDIRELKLEVSKHKNAVKNGNVIVTVNEEGFYE